MWSLGRNLEDSDANSDDDVFDLEFAEIPNRRLALEEQQRFLEWATRDIQQEAAQFLAPPARNRLASESFATLLDSSDGEDDVVPVSKKPRSQPHYNSDSEYDANSDIESDDPGDRTDPMVAAAKVQQVRDSVDSQMVMSSSDDQATSVGRRFDDSDIRNWYEHEFKIYAVAGQRKWDSGIVSLASPPSAVSVDLEEKSSVLIGTYRLKAINSLCIICRTHTLSLCPVCDGNFTEPCTATIGKCGHVFHTHCIDKWLSQSHRCPMDNRDWALEKKCSPAVDLRGSTFN